MNFLKDNWLKIAFLLLAVIALLYWVGLEKEKRDAAEARQFALDLQKKDSEEKELDVKRKQACFDIYQVENKKWSNVSSFRYDDSNNTCYIQYKASPKMTQAQCDKQYGESNLFFLDKMLCYDGLFEKSF